MAPNNPNKIIIHHSANGGLNPQFNSVNLYHKERFNFISSLGLYVGYHYFVESTGEVIKARLEKEEGAHTRGQNLSSVGICLAGNFDYQMPTAAQRNALVKLIDEIQVRWYIRENEIYPHRAFGDTSCYGKMLGNEWARETYSQYKKKDIYNKLFQLLEKLTKLLQCLKINLR